MILLKTKPILPGFNLSFGITICCISILILLPFCMIVLTANHLSFKDFISLILSARIVSAIKVTFFISFLAIITNIIFGSLIAWVLARYNFFGKSIMNALIDIPFALPTVVAGTTLAFLYADNGWIGKFFASDGLIGQFFPPNGIKIAFTKIGIWIALVFVSLPFIVRSVQPVLEQLDIDLEDAAKSLGASNANIFFKIILPNLFTCILTGASMGFARASGEYGAVIFIAGNIPYISEVLSLTIVYKLEEFDKTSASAIALIMLLISFSIIACVNLIQWYLTVKNNKK